MPARRFGFSFVGQSVISHLSNHAKGLIITGLGVLVMTPDGLLVRLISADPWTLLFWRGFLSAIGLTLGLALIYRRRTWRLIAGIGWAGVVTGIVFGVGTVAFITALTHTSVANTLFLVSTSPLFSALIAWRFLREPVAPRTWAAIVATIVGIAIIASGGLDDGTILGNLAALFGAMTLAVNFSVLRHHHKRNMVPSMGLGGLVAAAIALPLAEPHLVVGGDIAILAVMGLVMFPLSFGLLFVGPRYLPAPEVGLMMLLEAVLGPLWVWLAIGEDPGAATLVGGAVVIAALAVHSALALREERRASVTAAIQP